MPTRIADLATFARAALCYWLLVFPRVCRELRALRACADRIADPALRSIALDALAKRSNVDGAAAFAILAPPARRAAAVRALVALQAIYNHVDMLAERGEDPADDRVAFARRAHEALLGALAPADTGSDLDGGYLAELVDRARAATSELFSYAIVAPLARRAAERIVAFQSLSLGRAGELHRWADNDGASAHAAGPRLASPPRWWETAAAAGSSLAVHALLAAAASPRLTAAEAGEIAAVYSSSAAALHSLLDSLVDLDEDAAAGQLRLLDCYSSRDDAAAAMSELARDALASARRLPHGRRHALLVIAMACSYLGDVPARDARALPIAAAVREPLGPLVRPALAVFALRRRLASVSGAPAPARAHAPGAATVNATVASTVDQPLNASPDARAA